MTPQNILFVDDSPMVLSLLERTLSEERFTLHTAHTTKEALQVLEQHPIDVVVSDLLMPGLDGITFLRMIKEDYPHIVRIILSGHLHTQTILSAINQVGVFRFLTKPLELDDDTLKTILYEALDEAKLNRTHLNTDQSIAPALSVFIDSILNAPYRPYVLLNEQDIVTAVHVALAELYPVGSSLRHPAQEGIQLTAHSLYIPYDESESSDPDLYTVDTLTLGRSSLRLVRLSEIA
ncbi:response regulator [Paenibacillus sp. FSL R10-2782]|uniref:Two-component system response regulator n=1 Tax=Paenibacillus terrae TaxID=159743 RepID=A0A4U2Q3C3_9BACL|nr:response regulator [Paenibacillus terrae]TKH46647.1 two-component system response regulator [Paenibacillus terrae]